MNTYYLQFGLKRNPNGYQESCFFLDDELHQHCEEIARIQSESWINAREIVTEKKLT